MLYIKLNEVQAVMPEYNIYEFWLTHWPVLEVYRAELKMNLPFQDATRCQYKKYIPVGLAPDVEHVLQFLKVSLEAELQSVTKRGLTWKK